MARIFDNIDKQLLPALRETLEVSDRADFSVGYFNLRGWKQIDSFIERWPGGEGNCCRLLVGMHRSPDEELRKALSLAHHDEGIDNQTAIRLMKTLAEEFRAQLTIGVPTDEDERGLRRLAHQIKNKKVVVKLFLRHALHAKLYLLFRPDPVCRGQSFDWCNVRVLVYMRTPNDNDALSWINEQGESITESQYQILKAAECVPETPALQRRADHHDLVRKAVEIVLKEEKSVGGQLGRPSGARFRAYTRLKHYFDETKNTVFYSEELAKALDEIYRFPLLQTATDSLNRQLRIGVSDEQLAQLVTALREENKLCDIHEEERADEPQIICSLGLASTTKARTNTMPLDTQRTRQYLKAFEFRPLFSEETGWERYTSTIHARVDSLTFDLTGIAEKRGLVAFLCSSSDGRIPDYATRRKIEAQVTKTAFEHIIIYADAGHTTQIWQWVKREAGKPAASREHTYRPEQTGEALIQKLQAIVFSLEEEESLTTVSVAGRVRVAFDIEQITKRFYDRFKTEHAQFLKFIEGIPDKEIQRWYASVMINRLMFIYFIQKKGFLDGDTNYLRTRLDQSKQRGLDLFYSAFLSPLFFEGFAKKESERSASANKLLGKVPYLNGGLFLRHQIEEKHEHSLEICDSAFAKLFDFFDGYQWHLDERPLRQDNEINPDVLGYIFEKYINQKEVGAYYSKEDITDYIGKNTIIPFLFDKARGKCRIAFEGEHSIWRLLHADPGRYVHDAVKKGADLELPPHIAAGVQNVGKRGAWNTPASEEFALPTEIWREVVARRKRYQEVRSKLVAAEVRNINELITYNLDVRQFAQDVIQDCEGPELLRAFWHAVERVTVLDPACGSGAFLFAALNIMEPLYEACLDRMRAFLDELDRSSEKHRPEKFSDFRKILAHVSQHPNPRYFILKSIIINNLFGVDIMEEATEIYARSAPWVFALMMES